MSLLRSKKKHRKAVKQNWLQHCKLIRLKIDYYLL